MTQPKRYWITFIDERSSPRRVAGYMNVEESQDFSGGENYRFETGKVDEFQKFRAAHEGKWASAGTLKKILNRLADFKEEK